MEIVAKKFAEPNPVFTFAPATKMATDAVWNGGMGISTYLLERREGKGEAERMAQRATGKFNGRRNGQGESPAFLPP